MCDITMTLKLIAEILKKRELEEITKDMTLDDKIEFVNAIRALDVPAQYIEKHMV